MVYLGYQLIDILFYLDYWKLDLSQVSFLWLEDMFITAVAGSAANLTYVNIERHVVRIIRSIMTRERRAIFLERVFEDKFILGHLRSPNVTELLWRSYLGLRMKQTGCRLMKLPQPLCRANNSTTNSTDNINMPKYSAYSVRKPRVRARFP